MVPNKFYFIWPSHIHTHSDTSFSSEPEGLYAFMFIYYYMCSVMFKCIICWHVISTQSMVKQKLFFSEAKYCKMKISLHVLVFLFCKEPSRRLGIKEEFTDFLHIVFRDCFSSIDATQQISWSHKLCGISKSGLYSDLTQE